MNEFIYFWSFCFSAFLALWNPNCVSQVQDMIFHWVGFSKSCLSLWKFVCFWTRKKCWFLSMCLLLKLGCIQSGKSEINKSLLCRILNCLLVIATQREVILKAERKVSSLNSSFDCFRFLCSPCQTIFHNHLNHNKMQQEMEHASAGERNYCKFGLWECVRVWLTGPNSKNNWCLLFQTNKLALTL